MSQNTDLLGALHTLAVDIVVAPPTGINTADPSELTIQNMIQIFFGILAAVAVLVITIAALNFALSRGDPGKQAKARNTIIYAAVGLVVAVMANVIISLVVGLTG